MKLATIRLKKWVWITLIGLVFGLIVFYIDSQQGYKTCKGVYIKINQNDVEKNLVTKNEVQRLLSNGNKEVIVGVRFDKLSFQKMEERVSSNTLIKSCQISRSLTGDLIVVVEQHRPIARLLSTVGYDTANDKYVTENGAFISLSRHYTPRTLLLLGGYFEKLSALNRKKDENLLSLLKYINKDPFWRAQITEVEVSTEGDITFTPQMGNQVIDFGDSNPEEFDNRFRKLQIFYSQIAPIKGWDTYQRISVRFGSQVICEQVSVDSLAKK
jgi:cell division protein FtsQ